MLPKQNLVLEYVDTIAANVRTSSKIAPDMPGLVKRSGKQTTNFLAKEKARRKLKGI